MVPAIAYKLAQRKMREEAQPPSNGEMTLKEKALIFSLIALGVTGIGVAGYKTYRHFASRASEKKTFVAGTPATYAKQLRLALENEDRYGIELNEIRNVLRQIKDDEEMNKVRIEYQNQTGRVLYLDMEKLASTEYTELLLIMNGKPKKGQQGISEEQYRSWAMRLNYGFISKWGWGILPGTDEDAIKAVLLEIPTKADFARVAQAYEHEYGTPLMDDILGDMEVWEINEIVNIINKKR